jgi:hypothetical protein|tara:strand:- start:39 stop:269 length:231 start_codon:yes stop_codon:yes gene_type:complete
MNNPEGDAMHPAGIVIWIPFMVLLCACTHDLEFDNRMMDHLPRGAPEDADMRLFHDSIGWHHQMFEQEALFRTIGP